MKTGASLSCLQDSSDILLLQLHMVYLNYDNEL